MVPKLLKRFNLQPRLRPNLLMYKVFPLKVKEIQKQEKKYRIGIFGKYM